MLCLCPEFHFALVGFAPGRGITSVGLAFRGRPWRFSFGKWNVKVVAGTCHMPIVGLFVQPQPLPVRPRPHIRFYRSIWVRGFPSETSLRRCRPCTWDK